MKMKIWDRIVLALYALLGLGLLAWCTGSVIMPDLTNSIEESLRSAWKHPISMVIMCAAALVLLAWTVRVFLLAFKHEPRKDKSSVSIQNTENGAVRVSVAAMDALVRQAIGNAEGVMDIKSKILNHDDSISVKIEMTLSGNAHIPNVTMLLQRNIKSFIEEFSGIAVRDVSVLVSSIVPVEGPVAIAEPSVVKEEAQPEIVVEPETAVVQETAEMPEAVAEESGEPEEPEEIMEETAEEVTDEVTDETMQQEE